jgi:hypothetical protein
MALSLLCGARQRSWTSTWRLLQRTWCASVREPSGWQIHVAFDGAPCPQRMTDTANLEGRRKVGQAVRTALFGIWLEQHAVPRGEYRRPPSLWAGHRRRRLPPPRASRDGCPVLADCRGPRHSRPPPRGYACRGGYGVGGCLRSQAHPLRFPLASRGSHVPVGRGHRQTCPWPHSHPPRQRSVPLDRRGRGPARRVSATDSNCKRCCSMQGRGCE